MRARIKEKHEIAKGTLLVVFDLLGQEVEFRPGQYFFVTLPDRGHQDERGLRRHITAVTSPNEKGVLGLATRMRDTAFKRTLRDLPPGADVDVEPPKGKFVLPEDTSRPLVFIAGGLESRSFGACCATSARSDSRIGSRSCTRTATASRPRSSTSSASSRNTYPGSGWS